jgi:lysozyme
MKIGKSNMRKKLTPLATVIVAGIFTALVFVFGSLRYQVPNMAETKEEKQETVVVNKSLENNAVDLNKFAVDISAWQRPEDIDYNIMSQEIIGAIVRVQTGKSSKDNAAALKSGEDRQFKTHITELKKRGVPVAVYAYVNGKSVEEMKEQARSFYERAHTFKPTYYWLDIEEVSMDDMSKGVEAFRTELESLGVKNIGIYAQDWFLNDHQIDTSNFTSIWMADYGRNTGMWDTSPKTTLPYDMHQFTDRGQLTSYGGHLDLNMIRTQEQYDKIFRNPQ